MKGSIRIIAGLLIMMGAAGAESLGVIVVAATIGAIIMYSGVRAIEKKYGVL